MPKKKPAKRKPPAKPAAKNKGGRPRLEIDREQVKRLGEIHCTNEEIAAVIGCSVDTIERRFKALLEQCRLQGRVSVRRRQFALLMSDNLKAATTMSIWLGKNMLGQTDRQAIDHSGEIEIPDFRDAIERKLAESIARESAAGVSSEPNAAGG